MRKNHHIFFPAGSISLLLLPIFISCLYRNNATINSQAMDVVAFEENNSFFGKKSLDSIIENRHALVFRFSGIEKDERIALLNIKKSLFEASRSKDTTGIICIEFDKKADYWTLVKTLDLSYSSKNLTTILRQHQVLLYYPTPSKIEKDEIKKSQLFFCDVIRTNTTNAIDTNFVEYIKNEFILLIPFFKTYWSAILLFLLMVFFAFWKLEFMN